MPVAARAEVDLGADGVDHPVDEALEAAGQAVEHRGPGVGWCRRLHGQEAPHEAGVAAGGVGDLGGGRGDAEAVGVAGVDAADEGVDDALEHLVAEARADQLADRAVALGPVTGQFAGRVGRVVEVAAGDLDGLGRHQAAGGELVEVGGHAEDVGLGQAPQGAPHPEVGGGLVGADQLVEQAQLLAEVDRPRHAGEEGVRAQLDGQAGEGLRLDLAAEAVARLEQDDLGLGVLGQLVGGGEAGDAAADDDDAAHRPDPGIPAAARDPVLEAMARAERASSWVVPGGGGHQVGSSGGVAATTRSARAAITVGSALREAVRPKAMPTSSATALASMSRS